MSIKVICTECGKDITSRVNQQDAIYIHKRVCPGKKKKKK